MQSEEIALIWYDLFSIGWSIDAPLENVTGSAEANGDAAYGNMATCTDYHNSV